MTKNEKNEKKEATIPKTTGWCPLSWHFFTRKQHQTLE